MQNDVLLYQQKGTGPKARKDNNMYYIGRTETEVDYIESQDKNEAKKLAQATAAEYGIAYIIPADPDDEIEAVVNVKTAIRRLTKAVNKGEANAELMNNIVTAQDFAEGEAWDKLEELRNKVGRATVPGWD